MTADPGREQPQEAEQTNETEERWWIEAEPPAPSEPPERATPAEEDEPADGGLMARYSTPGPAMRTMSVLSPPVSDAESTEDQTAGRRTRRFIPEEDVLTIPPTPEAQLRAQLRQHAEGASAAASRDMWLLTDDPGVSAVGTAEVRSRAVTLVMVVIAVLFVLVLALGFIYLFLIR